MIKLEDASTQYNDMLGSAAADWHDSKGGLHDFAKSCQIDTDRYFPLAISIHPALPDTKGPWKLRVAFYVADTTVVGENGTAISDYGRKHGTIPTTKLSRVVTLDEFFGATKRFELVLRRPGFAEIEFEQGSE